MKTPLSKVYLDDYPIELMGDEARPPLSRIVRAAGKIPSRFDVIWLRARSDPNGAPVDPEEFIDRTSDPTRPIYLRTLPRLPAPGNATAASAPARPTLFGKSTPVTSRSLPASRTGQGPVQPGAVPGPTTPAGSLDGTPRSVAPRSYVEGPVPQTPGADPVIAQLGKPVVTEGDISAANVVPIVTRRVTGEPAEKAGREATRKRKRDERQANAEAAAQERQEEQREEEGILQDEAEERRDAADDADGAERSD